MKYTIQKKEWQEENLVENKKLQECLKFACNSHTLKVRNVKIMKARDVMCNPEQERHKEIKVNMEMLKNMLATPVRQKGLISFQQKIYIWISGI